MIKQYGTLEDTIYFWVAANDTSGSGGDGASPVADVRLAGAAVDAIPILSPTPTLLTHANYPAGCYELAVAATAANGFAANNTYAVFCTLAIDSQNPTGFVGSFDLKPILANAKQLGGTNQTGRDIGANVLLSSGSGAGQLDFTSGVVKSNLAQILGTALTETAGYIAAGFKKLFNIQTPVLTMESVNQGADNNTILAHADYGNAKLVRSTTPANKLDVSNTGEAGLDFANIKNATGAHTLTNITVPTCTTNTDMRGTNGANTTVPDAAGVAPTVVEIRQEIDSNSTRLDADMSSRASASEYDEDLEDIRTLLGDGGDVFYVSKTGDNSDGTTWAKAKTTIDAAIALCTANHCDRIYIGCGTYDETSATAGVVCDVAGIKIIGAMPGVIVNNTNTTNGSKVFYITANNVWLHNIKVEKGETTSDNAIDIDVDGSYVSADLRDVTIAVEKATHTGIRFTGGAVGCGYVNGPMGLSYIYSAAGVGTGIEAANCNNCVAIGAQLHTLTTGIKFTGGANCHDNMVSPYAMISSCTTGISLTVGCVNNMLSASILNCTDEYDDNSGNNTNKADGSLTYVLDDIKTHVDNGFDGVEGAGFDTLTDSLEAIRNRGDAEWITATGFSTHNAAAVKTAIEAAGSSIAQIKTKTDGLPSGIAKDKSVKMVEPLPD
jgi:hypothetical protein